ncbi:MAG: hypothetical protein RR197_00315 [Oscillospiraceae bacterium]
MHCKNCGEPLDAARSICRSCGAIRGNGELYCPVCGEALATPGDISCAACGADTRDKGEKGFVVPRQCRFSPVVSAFGSLLAPGFAQVANGQTFKGLAMFFVWLAIPRSLRMLRIGLTVLAAADAYQIASHLRQGETISVWRFF